MWPRAISNRSGGDLRHGVVVEPDPARALTGIARVRYPEGHGAQAANWKLRCCCISPADLVRDGKKAEEGHQLQRTEFFSGTWRAVRPCSFRNGSAAIQDWDRGDPTKLPQWRRARKFVSAVVARMVALLREFRAREIRKRVDHRDRCHNLTRDFGEFRAVDRVSFHVPRGTICAMLVPMAPGSRPRMKMLAGLLAPLRRLARSRWRTRSTQVFARSEDSPRHSARRSGAVRRSDGGRTPLALRADLRVSAHETSARSDQLLRLLDLENGRHTFLGECSPGMRKDIAGAGAAAQSARFVLDEPFEGVDPVTSKTIRDLLAASPAAVSRYF